MKKSGKILAVICAIALVLILTLALAACGTGTEYKYSGTECDNEMMADTIVSLYDGLYEGSTIRVSDKKIVWKVEDIDQVLTVVKRDGEKYDLNGDYLEKLGDTLDAGVEYYGLETEDGFDIVLTVSMGITFNVTIHFSK